MIYIAVNYPRRNQRTKSPNDVTGWMLYAVTQCAGRVSANTRPHHDQLRWSDWGDGNYHYTQSSSSYMTSLCFELRTLQLRNRLAMSSVRRILM